MGTQTGPNRLVGNADYPNAGAYASVRRADTRRVEQPQTHPRAYQDLVLRRARNHALCSNRAPPQ